MTVVRYRVVVRGQVGAELLERVGSCDARPGPGRTELLCDVVDQSQLMGLLSGLSQLGVEVISAAPLRAGRL